jgi:hypothetical protein
MEKPTDIIERFVIFGLAAAAFLVLPPQISARPLPVLW